MDRTMNNICDHLQQIEDIHTGDLVCTKCGLVLDQCYVQDERLNLQYRGIENKLKSSNDLIKHYLSVLFLPEKYAEMIENTMVKSFETYRMKKEVKIVAALCVVMLNNYIPISVKRIQSKLLSSPKDIKQCCYLVSCYPQKNLVSNDIYSLSDSILQCYGCSFQDIQSIKSIISSRLCENCSYSPVTIIVGNAFSFFWREGRNHSLKNLCDFVGITRNSIYSYLSPKKHQCIRTWL